MKPSFALLCLLLFPAGSVCHAQTDTLSISFGQAMQYLEKGNRSLKLSRKAVEQAKAERDELRAAWYPALQGNGAYVHLSQRIEVRQSLSALTDPAKELIQQAIPGEQLVSGLLDQIGGYTLAFPLAPRNLTSVGLSAEWLLFSGGKRMQAGKIGETMTEMAREAGRQTDATQRTLLAENYFGLRLAQETVSVRREAATGLKRHYEDALKLEANGMADKAVRLFAQSVWEEAERALSTSEREVTVLQASLRSLLGLPDSLYPQPTTPLFIGHELPARELFIGRMESGNSTLRQLHLQDGIALGKLRIEQSAYLPDIFLFGKQTLFSHGIASHLMPRTMVGIGFTWNLFDGMAREQRIRRAKLTRQSLSIGKELAREELAVAIDQLYSRLLTAQDNARTLETTIRLNEELLRIRRKSFAEGMATSAEVVDAETMLSAARLARLAACYDFDVTLMRLLALCGTPEEYPLTMNP